MTDSNEYNFDPLRMYFGEPFVISVEGLNDIVISEPTIGDILDYGEKEFYTMLNPFITNPTSNRVGLWDMGIDWNKISDYELFIMSVKGLQQSKTKLLFGDLDFQKFEMYKSKEESEDEKVSIVLYNFEQNVKIDEQIFNTISNYLRTMFGIFPKVEKAKGKTTKEWIIMEDREKLEKAKNEPVGSGLLPMVSGCLNHPGFKYKKNELKQVHIMEFMDSVKRLQIYESTRALLTGRFSGMIDTSKIDSKEFDFMRDISR